MAATNGAETHLSAAVTRAFTEPVPLPELFRARRHLIDGITFALHEVGELADDPTMRDAYFQIALDDAEVLDALEETLTERTRP